MFEVVIVVPVYGLFIHILCIVPSPIFFFTLKKIFYLFIFGVRAREGEREGVKHQCMVASHAPPTGDLTHNPGMCPDWELNQQPFGL